MNPNGVALVGASTRSAWTRMALDAFQAYGFEGDLHLINRRGTPVHGRPTSPSCQALGEAIDLAVILTPASAVEEVLRDVASAGAHSAVILAGGYAETQGAAEAQHRLIELARELDLLIVGPNCLGFVNVIDRKPCWVGASPERIVPGPLAIVSQSGAVGSTLLRYAADQDLGVSHLVTTGNQANLDILDAIGALLEDPRVRAVATFAESLTDAEEFFDVAARARELSKAIVMLKAGRSALAAEIARTHTGALVGDDRLVEAALRRAGVIRVHSLEELVLTGSLIAEVGPLGTGGVYFVSPSGGACDLIADTADAVGLPLPQPPAETTTALAERLPSGAVARNPVDVTGATLRDPELLADVIKLLGSSDDTALVGCIGSVAGRNQVGMLRGLGDGLTASGKPGVLIAQTAQTIGPRVREKARECGVPHLIAGLSCAMVALGHLSAWSAYLREPSWRRERPEADAPGRPDTVQLSEAQALAMLEEQGVRTPRWKLARTPSEAVAAAAAIGEPVVVKVCSPAIAHKSDFGGVALNLDTPEAVAAAFASVTTRAAEAHADAPIEGAIVAAMRPPALELLVGIVADEIWGLTLAVGFGGAWVDVLDDTSVRLLPVSGADVRSMLGELRGARLLDGPRGAPAADLDALVEAILGIARAAESLGSRMAALEVNPLWVNGSEVEALDALCTLRTPLTPHEREVARLVDHI